jgi:uncharacterized membrane protein YcfT
MTYFYQWGDLSRPTMLNEWNATFRMTKFLLLSSLFALKIFQYNFENYLDIFTTCKQNALLFN